MPQIQVLIPVPHILPSQTIVITTSVQSTSLQCRHSCYRFLDVLHASIIALSPACSPLRTQSSSFKMLVSSSQDLCLLALFLISLRTICICEILSDNRRYKGLPKWHNGKESVCQAGDTGDRNLIPGSGRSPRVGNGNPLQYSCLEKSMNKGAWQAAVYGVAKGWT